MEIEKFSKGPWTVTGDWQRRIRTFDGRAVAQVEIRTKGDYQANVELQKANAYLIAAAPEMYALLKDIMLNYQCMPNPYGVEQRIAAVLAKARGEEFKEEEK